MKKQQAGKHSAVQHAPSKWGARNTRIGLSEIPAGQQTEKQEGGELQRLYSMFPNGWPGRGLLLVRIVVFSFAAAGAAPAIFRTIGYSVILQIVATICAFLLLIGLCTPYAAIALALCEIGDTFSTPGSWPFALAFTGMGFSLAMLGPGALSVDARLFGRKRIVFKDREEKENAS